MAAEANGKMVATAPPWPYGIRGAPTERSFSISCMSAGTVGASLCPQKTLTLLCGPAEHSWGEGPCSFSQTQLPEWRGHP